MNRKRRLASLSSAIPIALSGVFGLSTLVQADDAMFLDEQGRVGVGTNIPVAPLHIQRSDGTAALRVEESSANTDLRGLLELVNNGAVKFEITNTSTGDLWDFSNRTSGFNITLRGTGGPEFLIQPDGAVKLGPGGSPNFIVRANGDAELTNGILTESSSRELKESIKPIDPTAVLSGLSELPIATWHYKDSSSKDRHMGPMAEDFHAAFGLGGGPKHIAPLDLASVAVAGVKGLHQKLNTQARLIEGLAAQNEELAAKNAALKDRIADLEALKAKNSRLEARLESLEQAVTEMASSEGSAHFASR